MDSWEPWSLCCCDVRPERDCIIQKSAAELWEAAAGTQTDLSGATGTRACAGRLGSQTEPSHLHGLEEHERALGVQSFSVTQTWVSLSLFSKDRSA